MNEPDDSAQARQFLITAEALLETIFEEKPPQEEAKFNRDDFTWAALDCIQVARGFLIRGHDEPPPQLQPFAAELIAQWQADYAIDQAKWQAKNSGKPDQAG
jgi:hypothetical protein